MDNIFSVFKSVLKEHMDLLGNSYLWLVVFFVILDISVVLQRVKKGLITIITRLQTGDDIPVRWLKHEV